MKKIGIVTLYYNNANYGGLLQAYALRDALQKLGYNSEQISYDLLSGYSNDYSLVKHKVKTQIKSFIPGYYSNNTKYNKALKKFEKSIPHSKYVNCDTISSLNDKYDAFICGSDQIWNPIGWQANFFLNYFTKPKISYAASIARDSLSTEELSFIKKNTEDFLSLSVREKCNADYLTKTLQKEFKLVPDPTLLLSKEEWNERFPVNFNTKKPYIFAYLLGFNEEQRNECIKFAKDNGLEIYFIPYMKKESYEWDKIHLNYCVKNYFVDNFIDMIRNAELVLTDSFHGTVFSCIFEKPFYVLNRQLVGDEKSMNSRMETLFFELGINKNRMVRNLSTINGYRFSEEEIDIIKESKAQWMKTGLNYLSNSLKEI